MDDVHFSSKDQTWRTPAEIWDALHAYAGGRPLHDAAPPHWSVDSLSERWDTLFDSPGVVYCNPPYGRGIGAWIDRAREVQSHDVILLLPARTDTRWFPQDATSLLFVRGRLRFVGAPHPAPFPSVLALYSDRQYATSLFETHFNEFGWMR